MTKEVQDIYDAALKFEEEYDEFNTTDNEMLIITLCTISIATKVYTEPDDQKLLKDSATRLFSLMKKVDN